MGLPRWYGNHVKSPTIQSLITDTQQTMSTAKNIIHLKLLACVCVFFLFKSVDYIVNLAAEKL